MISKKGFPGGSPQPWQRANQRANPKGDLACVGAEAAGWLHRSPISRPSAACCPCLRENKAFAVACEGDSLKLVGLLAPTDPLPAGSPSRLNQHEGAAAQPPAQIAPLDPQAMSRCPCHW